MQAYARSVLRRWAPSLLNIAADPPLPLDRGRAPGTQLSRGATTSAHNCDHKSSRAAARKVSPSAIYRRCGLPDVTRGL